MIDQQLSTELSAITTQYVEAAQRIVDKYIEARMRENKILARVGAKLTSRECQVLELILAGKADKEIADSLSVSVSTAKHHVSRILHKYHVYKRVNLFQLFRK